MEKINKLISRYLYLIIITLSLPAVRYLFVDGFFGVSDDLHIAWLHQMHRAVKSFQFPPRYVPDLSYGFGYPLFTFVYPLPFYIAEVFHLIGFSLVNSIKLVFGLSIPLSMLFMYKLLKTKLVQIAALAGAVLYVYNPYRSVEIFVRGSIGEIVSFVIFPLIILSFINLTKDKTSKKWLGIASLSVAALVLSHNIMAYMFMPFLLILVVARLLFNAKYKRQVVINSFLALVLGFLSCVYFWLPAIYESRLMKYDTVFNFYDHFPTLRQFITPYFGYGASVPGPYDTMSFYMGITGILVVFFGSILFAVKFKSFSKSEKTIIGWGLCVVFISIFMMNHRSAVLWENLPLIPYFQFPWRFLAMIALVIPLFMIPISKLKYGNWISISVILFAILLNYNYFKTSEYLGRGDDYYLNRYVPVPMVSEEYKQTSEEYLRLPKETLERPQDLFPRAYTQHDAMLNIEEINALDAKIKTSSSQDFVLNYSKYNYPGWLAKIDGKKTEIKTGEPYGQVTLNIPSGEHLVEITYNESTPRKFLDIISLISLGISLILITKYKDEKK